MFPIYASSFFTFIVLLLKYLQIFLRIQCMAQKSNSEDVVERGVGNNFEVVVKEVSFLEFIHNFSLHY